MAKQKKIKDRPLEPSAPEAGGMDPAGFKRWRKSLGLSQKQAAEYLGLKRRTVQYYEKGERDGEVFEIPKTVRLACFALINGVQDYAGPAAESDLDATDIPPATMGHDTVVPFAPPAD